MERPKHKHQCYLCLSFEWDKKLQMPVFAGYTMYSTPPWQLSANGLGAAALYVTESEEGYHKANEEMIEVVKRLAEIMPGQFWKTVWKWIDPSPEAHQERYELFMAVQKMRTEREQS